MKRGIAILLSLLLTACQQAEEPQQEIIYPEEPAVVELPEEPVTLEKSHEHSLSVGENVVEHEEVGYCGNTVTTVAHYSWGKEKEENWEYSFWGSESILLTDLLRYLDYSEDTCDCMPEYIVTLESGEEYGISLSEGYARHGNKQVSLTKEQAEDVRAVMDWLDSGVIID